MRLHGLYWLTVNLAHSTPLALAIDDVQWCDPPSLRWLAYLARRLESVPVCVLATLRPLEDEHPLLTELLADPAAAIVRPNALSVPSVAELVQQELGADAEEAFFLACHHATGGKPLLLRELLRTLAAEDVAPVAASVPSSNGSRPKPSPARCDFGWPSWSGGRSRPRRPRSRASISCARAAVLLRTPARP
jgi:predicted ATPase